MYHEGVRISRRRSRPVRRLRPGRFEFGRGWSLYCPPDPRTLLTVPHTWHQYLLGDTVEADHYHVSSIKSTSLTFIDELRLVIYPFFAVERSSWTFFQVNYITGDVKMWGWTEADTHVEAIVSCTGGEGRGGGGGVRSTDSKFCLAEEFFGTDIPDQRHGGHRGIHPRV